MASTASGKREDTAPGTNTMIAGVVFQLAAMAIFTVLAVDFARRAKAPSGIPRALRGVLGALFFSLAAIVARSIFRAVELAGGWTGHLMTHEASFIGLDGALMVLAVLVFLPFDPARVFPRRNEPLAEKLSASDAESSLSNARVA
jgi:hypothetical protein